MMSGTLSVSIWIRGTYQEFEKKHPKEDEDER